jgi:hypothetical protein
MNIKSKMTVNETIDAILKVAEVDGYKDMIQIIRHGEVVEVKIKKMGTSTLVFAFSENEAGSILTMTEESIAFAHKAFINKIIDWLSQTMLRLGGTLEV